MTRSSCCDRFVPPSSRSLRVNAGFATTCHDAASGDYRYCFPSNAARSIIDPLPDLVPITMSVHLGQMHLVLRDYKDGRADVRDRFALQLAALTVIFLSRHAACIGEWDCITTVPSSRRDAPAPVLDRVPRQLTGDRRPTLTAVSGLGGRHAQDGRFTVQRDVRGDRVLLLGGHLRQRRVDAQRLR